MELLNRNGGLPYGVGWVEFNYRASDFAYEDDVKINPTDMDFTIVLTTKN